MIHKCSIGGNKSITFGNKISHSGTKSRRKFLPNLNKYSFKSKIFKAYIKFRLSSYALKNIRNKNGIDNFLLRVKNTKISRKTSKVKKEIFLLLEKVNLKFKRYE